MKIRYGYRIEIICSQPTPLITLLDIHPSRRHDILIDEEVKRSHDVEVDTYVDQFGNICRRMVAPSGPFRLEAEGQIADSGLPDTFGDDVPVLNADKLPSDTLVFLLGSRYCETDRLSPHAWNMFGHIPTGLGRVKAVCDFVHQHLQFNYLNARSTRSAYEAFEERSGVCRDFAHLAIALCRALNIPSRYCTGYLGDIGVPKDIEPMDFSAWFEAYLDGKWYTFDARHNFPRIGRIVMGRGRDATDVPMLNTFGSHLLNHFEVITEEVKEDYASSSRIAQPIIQSNSATVMTV